MKPYKWLLLAVLFFLSAAAMLTLWSFDRQDYPLTVGAWILVLLGGSALFQRAIAKRHPEQWNEPGSRLLTRLHGVRLVGIAAITVGSFAELGWVASTGIFLFVGTIPIPFLERLRSGKGVLERLHPGLMLLALAAFFAYAFLPSQPSFFGWLALAALGSAILSVIAEPLFQRRLTTGRHPSAHQETPPSQSIL